MEFLNTFLAEKNEKKKIELLQDISGKQFRFFKKKVDDMMFGKTPLTKEQYKDILPHKDFLRGIVYTRYSTYIGYYLAPNYRIVQEILEILLNEDGAHPSNGASTSGNMEKSEPRDAGTSEEDSDSEPSSPEYSSEEGEKKRLGTIEEEGEEEEEDNTN